jgi:hypothetical protein
MICKRSIFFIFFILVNLAFSQKTATNLTNQKVNGYKGIWYELNQKHNGKDKYSGGLGTYTAKHMPLAVYSSVVNKTFFVYGGTTSKKEKHLLCMIGEYDHSTNLVSKPTVAYDKINVNDPHDNPSITIDDRGFIWVFVSGRGKFRKGIKLKSLEPYNIDKFEVISEEIFTYPQIWKTKKGFFHFFTKYTPKRELYYETSKDGISWSSDKSIALIKEKGAKYGGHYQVSSIHKSGKLIGTFFNRHINGNPDSRTDLYYVQTRNNGKTWEDVQKRKTKIPLRLAEAKERIVDYKSKGKNIYLKDMVFDSIGNPICLYLTSNGHESGPENRPYEWYVVKWTGKEWETNKVCESDHNYDMGSIFIDNSLWSVVAPTEDGPQEFGAGGEVAIWKSYDLGKNWVRDTTITKQSELNNSYVRRPLNSKAPFCFFWANGDTEKFSKSEMFFGDFDGNVWKLPYTMNEDFEKPIRVNHW